MTQHHGINYIELPMVDKEATKEFYGKVFGWNFTEWGEGYISFEGAGIDGGFNGMDLPVEKPGVLVVLFSQTLEDSEKAIKEAGCEINKEMFSFPGGRRFHFIDPNGNELAVWSDK